MIRTFPLKLDDNPVRSRSTVGIYELNGQIVFIHDELGDVPKEQITKDTVFPQHIVADFFSPDFSEHSRAHITYRERKVFFNTCAECYLDNGRLLLNTMRYVPSGYYQGDGKWGRAQPQSPVALAKLLEIRGDAIQELGPSPEPVEKIHSDSKTFRFGDFAVRMAKPFTMECVSASAGTAVWTYNSTAYLYTEIEERNGLLYFGTAGKGGRFCCVSLADGREVFTYDTGGTVRYYWYEGNVLLPDRKGDVLLLNPKDGAVLNRIAIRKPKLTATWHMLVRNSKLYFVASETKTPFALHAVCADL
jgi:hypothetical protein